MARRNLTRPNVILFVTDDQGYGDLSCHGNPLVRTPHLDALHAESVRLNHFQIDDFLYKTISGTRRTTRSFPPAGSA